MPNVSARYQTPIDETFRAIRAWNRILRRPTSVTLIRGGSARPSQTVRVEISEVTDQNNNTPTGIIGQQQVIVYGVIGHPDSEVADTDIQRGDRFILHGKEYKVETLVHQSGEVQAHGVAQR